MIKSEKDAFSRCFFTWKAIYMWVVLLPVASNPEKILDLPLVFGGKS